MAGGNLENLNIRISAESQKADKAISNLIGRMNQLNKAFGNLNIRGVGAFTSNVNKMASSLRSLNGVKISSPNITGLVKSIESFNKIDFSKIESGIEPTRQFASAMKSLESISNIPFQNVDTKNISSIINVIGKLNKIDSGKIPTVSSGIEKIASSMNTLSAAKFDDGSIKNVINSINRLLHADLDKFSPNEFTKITTAISDLSNIPDVSKGINGFVSALARLANAGDKSKKVSLELPTLTKELKKAVIGMSTTGHISKSTNQFVSSIARLVSAGDKSKYISSNLTILGDALTSLFSKMSVAPKISKNTLQLTQALSSLSSQSGKFKGAVAEISSGFGKMYDSSESTKGSFTTWGGAKSFVFGNLLYNALATGARALVNFGKEAVNLGSDITEVENVVDVAFGDMAGHAYKFASTAKEQFGLSELSAKRYTGTMMAMLKASGVAPEAAAQMSTSLAGLAGDLASFYNLNTDETFYKIRAGIAGEIEPLRQLGIDMTVASLEAYALANGITTSYREMDRGTQTMLRYSYLMSVTGEQQGDFARTSHTWANQVRLLTVNFQTLSATIGQGLISALLPVVTALNGLLSKLQSAANAFKAFMELITGNKNGGGGSQKGVVDDVSVPDTSDSFDMPEIGDATSGLEDMGSAGDDASSGIDKATDSAKKLKKALSVLSFDELNILSDLSDTSSDSGKGSGSGSGKKPSGSGGSSDLSGLTDIPLGADFDFGELDEEDTVIDDLIDGFEKLLKLIEPTTTAIKTLWNQGLKKLGEFTWGTIKDFWENFLKPIGVWMLSDQSGLPRFFYITNDLLNQIDWDRLKNSLAEFYTALQKPAKFTWTALMDFYDNFLRPVSVWTMSEAIPRLVDALTDFNNEINWNRINKSLADFWDAMAPFATSIGEGIVEFYEDLLKVGAKFINDTVPSGLDSLSRAVKRIDPDLLEDIGYGIGILTTGIAGFKLVKGLTGTIGNIFKKLKLYDGLKTTFKILGAFKYTPIVAGLGALVVAMDQFGVIDVDWDSLKSSLSNLFDSVKNLAEKIDWKTLAGAIVELAGALAKITVNVGQGLIDFSASIIKLITPAVTAVINGFATVIGALGSAIQKIPDSVLESITVGLTLFFAAWKTYTFASKIEDFIKKMFSMADVFKLLVKSEIDSVGLKISGLFKSLSAHPYAAIATGVLAVGGALYSAIKDMKDELAEERVSAMFENLENSGTVAISSLTENFATNAESISSSMESINEKINTIGQTNESINGTKDNIKKIAEAIELGAYTAEEKIPQLKGLFDQLLNDTRSVFDEQYNVIVEGLAGGFNDTLEAIGVSSPELIALIKRVRDGMTENIDAIQEEINQLDESYNNGEISAEEYYNRYGELVAQLSNTKVDTTQIDQAGDSFDNLKGKVNISEWIKDGQLDTSAVDETFKQLSQIFSDTKTNVETETDGIKQSLQSFYDEALAQGIPESDLTDLAAAIAGTDTEREMQLGELTQYFTNVTNTIQNGLIEKIPEIAEKARLEWENLNPVEQMLSGGQTNYVNDVLNDYKTNVLDPLSTKLGTLYTQLGIDGSVYAGNAGGEIINGLTTSLSNNMYGIADSTAEELRAFAQQIVDAGLTNVDGSMTELMKSIQNVNSTVNDLDFSIMVTKAANAIDGAHGVWVNGEQIFGMDAINLYNAIMSGKLSELPDGGYQLANGAVVKMGNAFEDGRPGFLSTVSSLVSAGAETLQSYYDTYKQGGSGLVTSANQGAQESSGGITKAINDDITEANQKIIDSKIPLQSSGTYLVDGAIDGVKSKRLDFTNTMGELAEDGFNSFNRKVGINSPSIKMMESGRYLIEGLYKGVDSNKNKSINQMKILAKELYDAMGNLNVKFQERGRDIGNGIKAGFNNNFPSLISLFSALPRQIDSAIGSLYSIGVRAAQSLANGFRAVHIPTPHFSVSTVGASAAGVSFSLPSVNVGWYASGGFPRMGDLFYANERGPEMIGMMGKKPVVANNMQITEGIKSAVVEGMLEVFAVSGGNQNQNQQSIVIELKTDNETLARAVYKGADSISRRMNPGTYLFDGI